MTVDFADDRDDPSQPPIDPGELSAIAQTTLAAEGLAAAEVSIQLVDPAAMAELNQAHLGRSGPTDVLAFPLESLSPGSAPQLVAPAVPFLIGDVFVCPQVVASNAAAAGVPFPDEMALMVVHGILHLLGYDHVVDADAERMEQRERELLAAVEKRRP